VDTGRISDVNPALKAEVTPMGKRKKTAGVEWSCKLRGYTILRGIKASSSNE
jgi:hypothetical protein